MHKVLSSSNGLFVGRIHGPSSFYIQVVAAFTIALQNAVFQAVFFIRLQKDRTGSIAEDHTGGPVGVIEDGGHLVSSHDQHFLVHATHDELASGRKPINESGAGSLKIEGGCVMATQDVSDLCCSGGHDHVWGDRAGQNKIHFRGFYSSLAQCFFSSFYKHFRSAPSFAFQHTAFAYAGSGGDPLIGGIHHSLEDLIGHNELWQVTTYSRYGRFQCAHSDL